MTSPSERVWTLRATNGRIKLQDLRHFLQTLPIDDPEAPVSFLDGAISVTTLRQR